MKKASKQAKGHLKKIFIVLFLQLIMCVCLCIQYTQETLAQDKASFKNMTILSVDDLPSGKLLLAGKLVRTSSLKDTLYIYPNSSRRFAVQLMHLPAIISLLKDKNNVLMEVLIPDKSITTITSTSSLSSVRFAKFISLKGMATHNDLYKNAITILQ
ncbi:MAG: hypothetical protein HQK51_11640 [Oligoflexia bacterium]|nr:hypothetical protein [Oligoflexia bacterium]